MRRPCPALMGAVLCCGLLFASACSEDPSEPGNRSLAGRMGLSLEQADAPIVVTATPPTIVIDTTNPATPTDPGSGKFIGTSNIQATVHDTDGNVRVGVEVVFSTSYGTLGSGGLPVVTNDQGIANDVLTVDQDAPDTVNVTATSGEDSGVAAVAVDVIFPNQPPVAEAGPDQTAECNSPSGTPVAVDGTASTDPDSTPGTNDDITTYEWLVNGAVVADTATATLTLPTGVTTVTLRVTDSQGATDTDELVVTVADTTPPVLTVVPRPDVLWPPNHKMHTVNVQVEMVDACSPPSASSVNLVSVSSDEPDNGTGDGNTEGDIAGASLGTDDRSLQLRAERSGSGHGRTYTLVYAATDAAGLSTEATAYVRVPHDQGH